jgi:hypothetical protein
MKTLVVLELDIDWVVLAGLGFVTRDCKVGFPGDFVERVFDFLVLEIR